MANNCMHDSKVILTVLPRPHTPACRYKVSFDEYVTVNPGKYWHAGISEVIEFFLIEQILK